MRGKTTVQATEGGEGALGSCVLKCVHRHRHSSDPRQASSGVPVTIVWHMLKQLNTPGTDSLVHFNLSLTARVDMTPTCLVVFLLH